jgi:hypothetical protein
VTSWIVPRRSQKILTFNGLAGTGQFASPTVPIFTVTGKILVVAFVPSCTVDLVSAGGGTLLLGVVGSTSLFLGATTATAIDVGEFWINATPVAAGVALPAGFKDILVAANIVGTVGTADITAGVIQFDLLWLPLAKNAEVSAA